MAESIDLKDKPLDLKKTLECGQTFSWRKIKENGKNKYVTVRNGGVLEVWQDGDELLYENYGNEIDLRKALRLEDPLEEIYKKIDRDGFIHRSIKANRGFRLVRDEFFPCLIAYITSAQMQIPRIRRVQRDIENRYGRPLRFDGEEYYEFPESGELTEVSEEELRELSIGYRAEYVKRSAEMVRDGVVKEKQLRKMDYKQAREELKMLSGVGNKVADCVLLFALDFTEAFPIDTWIKKVIKKKYPDLYSKNYGELSENMRSYFGEYAGYAQEYLFYYGRTCMDL
ncbi:MAG: DNA-3-methyladenine glycosylase family protein [Candidatus Aenigmatarchaeota archaeon]